MGHTIEDVLAGLREQLEEANGELAGVEQELGSRTPARARIAALQAARRRLWRRRQLLHDVIEQLERPRRPQR